MDAVAVLLLLLVAGVALLLLYFEGLLKRPSQVLVCAGLVAAAFVLRALCFSYETLDYQDFLSNGCSTSGTTGVLRRFRVR